MRTKAWFMLQCTWSHKFCYFISVCVATAPLPEKAQQYLVFSVEMFRNCVGLLSTSCHCHVFFLCSFVSVNTEKVKWVLYSCVWIWIRLPLCRIHTHSTQPLCVSIWFYCRSVILILVTLLWLLTYFSFFCGKKWGNETDVYIECAVLLCTVKVILNFFVMCNKMMWTNCVTWNAIVTNRDGMAGEMQQLFSFFRDEMRRRL